MRVIHCTNCGYRPLRQPSEDSSTDGTITMSVASMVAMARCMSMGIPLANISGPVSIPTISARNGAGVPGLIN